MTEWIREKQYRNPKIDFQKKQFSVPSTICTPYALSKTSRSNVFGILFIFKHFCSYGFHKSIMENCQLIHAIYTVQHFSQSLESFKNFNVTVSEKYVCNLGLCFSHVHYIWMYYRVPKLVSWVACHDHLTVVL